MKQHLEEEDLILHFYGETGSAAEPHLSDCAECRGRYQALVAGDEFGRFGGCSASAGGV